MKELRLHAPAKINWTLSILGKRPDGYHEIDTVMQTIDLCDELVFREHHAHGLHYSGAPAIPRASDLIVRAFELLQDKIGARGLEIQLIKRIPIGAGLGGGSTDAATALLGINKLLDLGLSTPQLVDCASRLGSDVPFFIHGGAARCRGRGEIITPLDSKLPKVTLAVVFPRFHSSTAAAYAALKAEDYGNSEASERAARALGTGDLAGLLEARSNTFDRVLSKIDPRYDAVKEAMRIEGVLAPILTGSGSACFGVVPNPGVGSDVLRRLQKNYPASYFVSPASGAGENYGSG
jgi:4-diphosphocytidyl-2-C-methyl-D-erythritol kinase